MSKNNRPTMIAYTVRNRAKGQKAIWTRIGAAWAHQGERPGFSLELEAFPALDGRIVLIEPKAGEAESEPPLEDEAA